MEGEVETKLPRSVRTKDGPPEPEESFRSRPRAKTHLYVSAEIGAFQHSLTTDLLNHLVFVQKSFMKVCTDGRQFCFVSVIGNGKIQCGIKAFMIL